MKVNIDKTLEVTDEQRKQIAAFLDDEGAKKRDATRDEMKDFIWEHGANWEHVLDGTWTKQDEDPAGFTDQEDLPEIDAELESLL
jgi:hypothetical protein